MPRSQASADVAPQTQIDALQAFETAHSYIHEHSPDYWEPPFTIRYHDRAEQWIISTRTNKSRGNVEITIDASDGRVIDSHWTPMR